MYGLICFRFRFRFCFVSVAYLRPFLLSSGSFPRALFLKRNIQAGSGPAFTPYRQKGSLVDTYTSKYFVCGFY